jgi:hypothetical protein
VWASPRRTTAGPRHATASASVPEWRDRSWQFRKGKRIEVAVAARLTVNDPELAIRAALDGGRAVYGPQLCMPPPQSPPVQTRRHRPQRHPSLLGLPARHRGRRAGTPDGFRPELASGYRVPGFWRGCPCRGGAVQIDTQPLDADLYACAEYGVEHFRATTNVLITGENYPRIERRSSKAPTPVTARTGHRRSGW